MRGPLVIVAGALIASCADSPSGDSRRGYAPSEACPLKTSADWQAFVENASSQPEWVETCSDLNDCEELSEFSDYLEQDVLAVLEHCSSDIAENPWLDACTDRLRRVVPSYLDQHSPSSYGFAQENAAYFAAQTAPDVPPDMMGVPDEILSALPSRTAIEALARDRGWPYLTHDSCLGGVRLFMVVPDPEDRFERWILFGLHGDLTTVEVPAIVSFIAVQKKDSTGSSLERVRLHFRDYVVSPTSKSGFELSLPENYAGKCYACHASGLRLLVPSPSEALDSAPVRGEPGYGDAQPSNFASKRLASLNQRMLDYGLPDWNGTVVPDDHGPALGSELGCVSCHDGVSRGTLSVSTSEGMLWQKVVEQLSMQAIGAGKLVPDVRAMELLERERSGDPELSASEVAELELARASHQRDYDALMSSRLPELQRWLREVRCE